MPDIHAFPRAEYRGDLEIGDISIPCFVLEDGTRVISGRGMTTAIGMRGRGSGVERVVKHRAFAPYFPPKLAQALSEPIRFVGSTSRTSTPTAGYEATILHGVCEAVLTARDNGDLKTEQEKRYAIYCDVLMRAFAKVGIIALVDEATGYQEVRARNELHRILEAYISSELLPWAKRFPDEFYAELFRLRGWKYSPLSVKRPGYVGKLTDRLVYEKLPPGVLDELRAKNPRATPAGHRRYKHHQLLSEDIGHLHLEKHLASVITLMRASSNWQQFERLFERAYPTFPRQLGLLEDSDG